ncbi:hepatic and glial cell adhesion molecule isoform X2 [Amia ocellicauda]|uniref:hepatic and glial cell adhesion molecule isoform X2 n=1 Tax=Amia ocellicauda TaxID=2972642 RepID=UPI00346493BA
MKRQTTVWLLCISFPFLTVGQAKDLELCEALSSSVLLPGFSDVDVGASLSWQFTGNKGTRAVVDYTMSSAEPTVDPHYRGRSQFFPSNTSVLLQDLKRSDQGLYTLTVQGAAVRTKNVSLSILQPVANPLILGFVEHSSVELRCSVVFGDWPQFSWERVGVPLANGTKYVLREAEDESSLTIQDLQGTDCGRYTCVVSSPVSREEDSYELDSDLIMKKRGDYEKTPEETHQIAS